MNIADQLKEQAAINKKIGAVKAPVPNVKNKPDIVVKKKGRGKK